MPDNPQHEDCLVDANLSPSDSSVSVLVVIVNYRTADLACDALGSLSTELLALPRMQVVVVDNASGDGSVERLRRYATGQPAGDRIKIVPMDENGGFAHGNNVAIRPSIESASPPEFFLLLNPDTRVRPAAVTKLLEFMLMHPRVGLAGSRLEDPDGTPQRSAFRFPSIASEIERSVRWKPVSRLLSHRVVAPPVPQQESETHWVAGASLMIRRQVFDEVGLLDERYFMYFEEVDFCRRAARAGWPCWYVPDSRVVHLVGQSSGVTNTRRPPRRRPAYWFESRRRYFLRNHGRLFTIASDFVFIGGFLLWRLRRRILGRPDPDPPRFLTDFCRHSVLFRGFS